MRQNCCLNKTRTVSFHILSASSFEAIDHPKLCNFTRSSETVVKWPESQTLIFTDVVILLRQMFTLCPGDHSVSFLSSPKEMPGCHLNNSSRPLPYHSKSSTPFNDAVEKASLNKLRHFLVESRQEHRETRPPIC
jgi:hypothetical protein